MIISDWQMLIGLAELVISYIMLYIAVALYLDSKNDDNKNNRP